MHDIESLKFVFLLKYPENGAQDVAEFKKDLETLEGFVKEYDYDPSRFDFTFGDGE